jgi:hypothetical protein
MVASRSPRGPTRRLATIATTFPIVLAPQFTLALFVVWSEARDDRGLGRGLDFGRDTGRLFDAPARDVFLVQVSYWLGR